MRKINLNAQKQVLLREHLRLDVSEEERNEPKWTCGCTENPIRSVGYPQSCQSIITTILAFSQEVFDCSSRYELYQDSITGITQICLTCFHSEITALLKDMSLKLGPQNVKPMVPAL